MKFLSTLSFLFLLSGYVDAQGNHVLEQRLDTYVSDLQEAYGIPGMSLAIIRNGEVIHYRNYGLASVEHQVPISDRSIYRVYSLTKPIVVVALFQLIEEGELDLEDEVGKYVEGLPATWRERKISHLINHTSGLPDIVKYKKESEEEASRLVFADSLRFVAGSRYEYNQSNYWLVKRIIEAITGQDFADFIIKGQFPGANGNAFFSTDSRDIVRDRVTSYFPFAEGRIQIDLPFRDDYLTAANGLNLTMGQFIDWDAKLRNGELLSTEVKKEMWTQYPYADSDHAFSNNWDVVQVNGHLSYGFSGSMITGYQVFPSQDLSVILLSNGFEKWYGIADAIRYVAGIVDESLVEPSEVVYETLRKLAATSDVTTLRPRIDSLKQMLAYQSVAFETQINRAGYTTLRTVADKERAVSLFELNTAYYPGSWNAFDSLGEALEENGEWERAAASYERALALNTQNDNDHNDTLRKRIERLRKN